MIEATPQASSFQTVDDAVKTALRLKASDFHLSPSATHYSVRMRCNGVLGKATPLPTETGRALLQAFKASAKMNIAETRRPQDARLSQDNVEMRLATHPTLHGENLVIRFLTLHHRRSLNELGLIPRVLNTLQTMTSPSHGLTLVAGPTGSGKTTTLHAMLNALGNCAGRIATLEDPVEIIHPEAAQTDLSRLPHLDFASGLRSLMRQDPDTILVGEVRDEETAALTLNAALTGHRVFASIHAPDCAGALCRLVELGLNFGSLMNCLNGVAALRLKITTNQTARFLQAEVLNLLDLPRATVLACKSIEELMSHLNENNHIDFNHSRKADDV
jgi:general secretion pathway protein E